MRDGPHDRAQREHAPCEPQRGDHRGCDRRVGRATTGATRLAPPPTCRGTSAAPRACTVLATCLRQGTGSEEAPPPPPPPTPPPTHERGEDSEKTARGHGGGGGGAEDRPKRRGERRVTSGKKKKKKKKTPMRQSMGRQEIRHRVYQAPGTSPEGRQLRGIGGDR